MGDKINFMALSCQNTGLFQSFMAYYAKTDYFLCVYELVNKVEIYFMEVHCIKTDYLCAFMNW